MCLCWLAALLIKALYFVFISLPFRPSRSLSLSPSPSPLFHPRPFTMRPGLNWILNDPEPIEQFLLPFFFPPLARSLRPPFKNSPNRAVRGIVFSSKGLCRSPHLPRELCRLSGTERTEGGDETEEGRPLKCRKWKNLENEIRAFSTSHQPLRLFSQRRSACFRKMSQWLKLTPPLPCEEVRKAFVLFFFLSP